MTMITPSYLGETIEYSSLHACRSTLEDPTQFTLRQTVDAFESLDLDRGEKDKILYETAHKLLTPKVPD